MFDILSIYFDFCDDRVNLNTRGVQDSTIKKPVPFQ